MSEPNYKDFDAFFAEMDLKPLKFKIRGEVFELPPTIPAAIVKHIVNLQRSGVDVVPNEITLDMGKHIFGEETLDRLVDDLRLDMYQLGQIIDWAVLAYMGNGADELQNELGKMQAQKKRPKRRPKKKNSSTSLSIGQQ
jgi:hypothetical protein